MNSLTEQDIKRIVEQWLREAVAMTEEARALSGPYNENVLAEERGDLKQAERRYRDLLASRRYATMEQLAEGLASEYGLTVDKTSVEFKRLCRELVKAHLVHVKTEQRRAKSEFDNDLPEVPSSGGATVSPDSVKLTPLPASGADIAVA